MASQASDCVKELGGIGSGIAKGSHRLGDPDTDGIIGDVTKFARQLDGPDGNGSPNRPITININVEGDGPDKTPSGPGIGIGGIGGIGGVTAHDRPNGPVSVPMGDSRSKSSPDVETDLSRLLEQLGKGIDAVRHEGTKTSDPTADAANRPQAHDRQLADAPEDASQHGEAEASLV